MQRPKPRTTISEVTPRSDFLRNLIEDANAEIVTPLKPELSDKFHSGLLTFLKIPAHILWIFAIDGKFFQRENGPIGFAKREKNSVEGILKGLMAAILSATESEFTIKQLQSIHQVCMQDTETKSKYLVPGQLRTEVKTNTAVYMKIEKGWSSVEGLQELVNEGGELRFLAQIKNNEPYFNLPIGKDADFKSIHAEIEQGKGGLYYFPPRDDCNERMAKIIVNYNKAISFFALRSESLMPDAQLKLLALTAKLLAQTHPFKDGNNRTIVNGFLNSRLIQFGFLPVLMLEPNIFEFHTVNQLVTKIKEAMVQTQEIMQNPDAEIYGFKISSLKITTKEEKEIFASIQEASRAIKSELSAKLLNPLGEYSYASFFNNSKERTIRRLLDNDTTFGLYNVNF